MFGSVPPEVRTHIAIEIAVFSVDFGNLQLASVIGVALAQIFFRRVRNDAIHEAGAVHERDVQAVDEVDAVQDAGAILEKDAVDIAGAIDVAETIDVVNEQAVDNVQAILVLDAQAVNKTHAVLDAQAVDNADGVDPVEAVVDNHRVTHRDVIRARGAAVGIATCHQDRGKRKARQYFQDF